LIQVVRSRDLLWPLGLIAVLAICNLIWLKVDAQLPMYDMAGHAINTQRLIQSFRERPFTETLSLMFTLSPYPPLTYLYAAVWGALSWPTADVFTGAMTGYVALLVIASHQSGRMLGGRAAGRLSALLVSTYPIVAGLSRHYLLDVPLVAMTSACFWALLRSRKFNRAGPAIVFGVTVGLGMLTKWTLVVFMAAPVLAVALAAIRRGLSRRRMANGLAAFGTAVAIALPWYAVNLARQLEFLRIAGGWFANAEGDAALSPAARFVENIRFLINDHMILPAFAFMGAGALVAWIRGRRRLAFMLISAIGLPLLAFSIYPNLDSRYTIPSLVFAAALTACGFGALPRRAPRRIAIGAVVSWAVFEYVAVSFGGLRLVDQRIQERVTWPASSPISLVVYAERVHIADHPDPAPWPIRDIVDAILVDRKSLGATKRSIVVSLSNTPKLEPNILTYLGGSDHLPLVGAAYDVIGQQGEAAFDLKRADYILAKTGDLGPSWSLGWGPKVNAALLDPGNAVQSQVLKRGTITLPDRSVVTIYRVLRPAGVSP
jgi:4-amino-4-deoxy-L-arabinose transferase-like glycosyltransferase